MKEERERGVHGEVHCGPLSCGPRGGGPHAPREATLQTPRFFSRKFSFSLEVSGERKLPVFVEYVKKVFQNFFFMRHQTAENNFSTEIFFSGLFYKYPNTPLVNLWFNYTNS